MEEIIMEIRNLTNADFDEVIKNEKLVLVDFWAAWCGPCKSMAPVLDKIASERDDISICKVNVDEEPELAEKFEIMSIPTFVAIKNNTVVGKTIGMQSKTEILKLF